MKGSSRPLAGGPERPAWGRGSRVLLLAFGVMVFSLPFLSCSGKAPELLGLSWQLIQEDTGQGIVEKLMVGATVRDEDGLADLEKVYLISDSAELFWKSDKSHWTLDESSGIARIGLSDIRMADGSPIPRGGYRLLLLDGAGERAERNLVIAPPSTLGVKPLKLLRSNGKLRISGPEGKKSLFLYDKSGALIESFDMSSMEIDQASILAGELSSRVASMRGYSFDQGNNLGYLSAPLLP